MHFRSQIVVVDDDREFGLILSKVIAKEGYDVVTYTDPCEAVRAIQKSDTAQLVITDLQMPGMNGIQLSEKLATILPHAEIIMVSSHATDTTRSRARDAGIFAVFEKPTHMPALMETIKKALQSNRAWRTQKDATTSSKPKLLFIDDYKLLLRVFSQYFSLKGFEVHTAAFGQQGLSMALHENYHTVIVDIGLPDISGIEVVRQIHRHSPSLPIYAFTGEVCREEAELATKAGARAVLTKPMSPRKLEECLLHNRQELVEKKSCDHNLKPRSSFWQNRTACKKLALALKNYCQINRRRLFTAGIVILSIAVTTWGLIYFQKSQLEWRKKPESKSDLERIISIMERGEKYLGRDEKRELGETRF